MDDHLVQWLNLALRWGHVVAGAAWIGTSFYFNWLNSRIAPPRQPEAGVSGELWSVHGGGFYRVVKYAVAPDRLPETLHWFKWEAYATWITGFALLVLIYYLQADAYLVWAAGGPLGAGGAVAVGIGSLLVTWLGYDALCRSLARAPGALAATGFALLVALAWGLSRFLSPRAAYMHVGAALGTIMAANVFRVIIPAQRDMVAAMAAGRPPDAARGAQAALRSLHNNYVTLPVLFVMVSGHYPATYGHAWNWAILGGLALAGAAARHWFNLRNQGRRNAWVLPAAAVGVLALAFVTAPKSPPGENASFAAARVIIAQRCAPCHSTAPTLAGFTAPPAGVVLDTPDQIRAQAARILAASVTSEAMPLGNVTGMTAGERALLGRWVRSGAVIR